MFAINTVPTDGMALVVDAPYICQTNNWNIETKVHGSMEYTVKPLI